MKKKILLTICARAGSKGLKNKNWLLLNKKPLIQWTIEQAIKWGKAKDIVVTTNSIRAEDVAYNFPECHILRRVDKLSSDNAPKLDVLRDALNRMQKLYGEYDVLIDLDITNPLRKISDIQKSYDLFLKNDVDTVITGCVARKNPYFNQIVRGKKDSRVKMLFDKVNTARQHAPKMYDMNASVYVYKTEWLKNKKHKHPITTNTLMHQMEEWQQFDIDTEVDFYIVAQLQKKYAELLGINRPLQKRSRF